MKHRDDFFIFAQIHNHCVKYYAWTGFLSSCFRRPGFAIKLRHEHDDEYTIFLIDGMTHSVVKHKHGVKLSKELIMFIEKHYQTDIQELQLNALKSINDKLSEIQGDVHEAKYSDALSTMSERIAGMSQCLSGMSDELERHSIVCKDMYGRETDKRAFNVHEAQ